MIPRSPIRVGGRGFQVGPAPGMIGAGGPQRFGQGIVQPEPLMGRFKKGGKVKKTGAYKLEKGERVLTKAQQRKRKKSDSHAYVAGRRA